MGVTHGRHRATIVKMIIAAAVTATTMLLVQNWGSIFNPTPRPFRLAERNVSHILVTGGAGFIGSHATLRLLSDGHRVTIVDNLSRGNMGAVRVLQGLAPKNRLQFAYADLGDPKAIDTLFQNNAIDTVIHFAAVAYVGESMAEPLRYYHNITSNTLHLLQAMVRHNVLRLIYSSTCATYGEPEKMPIVESTPQLPINPYGRSKKMAEDVILDYAQSNKALAVTILRYFNVIGSDAKGRLGEVPRAELRGYGRISGACFDAAMGNIPGLKILGTDYSTPDGTCVRDFIEVTDLVDAHVAAMGKLRAGPPKIYNVGTGKGSSVKEFVSACLNVTGRPIKVVEVKERRPGDYAEVYSDPSKIKMELGWVAKNTDLRETLRVAWKWRELHPNGYE